MFSRPANNTVFNNQIPRSYDWRKIKLESTCFIYIWSYWCHNKSKELRQRSTPSLYYALIYPYFTYCHKVWGSTYQYNIDTLEKLKKKTVRIICSANHYSHTGKLYDELTILKIRGIYCYLVGQFMFRFYHTLLPRIFDEYFVQHDVFHTYDTRNAHLYRLPTFQKSNGRRSISFCGVKVWEQILNCKIDLDISQPVFKKYVKRCLLNQEVVKWKEL